MGGAGGVDINRRVLVVCVHWRKTANDLSFKAEGEDSVLGSEGRGSLWKVTLSGTWV